MSDARRTRSTDEMPEASDSELELAARLLRALSHRVRGDLSVVTNDLVYLSSLVDPAELERPRARCASIASSLTSLGLLTSTSYRQQRPLSSLSSLLGLALDQSSSSSDRISIDERLVGEAALLLQRLFGPWTGSVATAGDSSELVVCVLHFDQPCALQRSYSSVGRIAAAELGERFVVEACIVDLIVRDHDWHVRLFQARERLVCEITLTRCLD